MHRLALQLVMQPNAGDHGELGASTSRDLVVGREIHVLTTNTIRT